MDKLIIKGNADLKGSIKIKGSKNAALPIMISSLLSNETLKLKNIPKLDDIKNMIKLLRSYGSTIKRNKDQLEISCKNIINKDADYDIVRKMRASILILGPLISRFGTAKISLPGGCAIGTRPIDIHLEGLKKLGANFSIENGYVVGQVKNGLVGNHVPLSFPSVGATENIMMASTLAKGKTIIENAAMEPEIFDLAGCLNKMGAKIKIKNNGIIQIDGVSRLVTSSHKIMSDRIVAGTFIIAAVMLNKKFEVKDTDTDDLGALIKALEKEIESIDRQIKALEQVQYSEDDVISMNRRMLGGDHSLNAQMNKNDGEETEWQDLLTDDRENQETLFEKHEEKTIRSKLMIDALNLLKSREKDIIIKRRLTDNPMTLEDLSQEYKVSRERIRQIENRAFEKLQEAMKLKASEIKLI